MISHTTSVFRLDSKDSLSKAIKKSKDQRLFVCGLCGLDQERIFHLFSGKLFPKVGLNTCKGCLYVSLNKYCFDRAPENKSIVLERSCSEKFHKFHGKEP